MSDKWSVNKSGVVTGAFRVALFSAPSSGWIGYNSTDASTWCGYGSSADVSGTACGYGAVASGTSCAMGHSAFAGFNGYAMGASAYAYSDCIAIGYNARAGEISLGADCIAIGADSAADDGGISIGYGANTYGTGIAIGAYSSATYGIAIGAYAEANSPNSMALGYRSKTSRESEIMHSADGAATPKNSWSFFSWYHSTTDATPVTATTTFTTVASSAIMMTVDVVAFDDTNSCAKGWKIETALNVSSGSVLSMATASSENYAVGGGTTGSWNAVVGTSGSYVTLTVTGATGVTVKWTARVTLTEVRE